MSRVLRYLEMPVSDPTRKRSSTAICMLTGQVDALVNRPPPDHGVGCQCVAYAWAPVGAAMPVLLFASARAGVPFAPLNYRLTTDALVELIERLPGAVVVADADYAGCPLPRAFRCLTRPTSSTSAQPPELRPRQATWTRMRSRWCCSPGTTSKPKAVEITHANLCHQLRDGGTVDFCFRRPGRRRPDLCTAVPHRRAWCGAVVSVRGRRAIYLQRFDPAAHSLVHDEGVTNAIRVPTMPTASSPPREGPGRAALPPGNPPLRRFQGAAAARAPHPRPARRRGLNNAYGLTETSSTIAVLGPDDHREAYGWDDPAIGAWVPVGRSWCPASNCRSVTPTARCSGADETGELFIRGPQVSGKYTGIGSVPTPKAGSHQSDIASIDADGYLFIGGRSDDTIIRGGENIAPAEVEDALGAPADPGGRRDRCRRSRMGTGDRGRRRA